MASKEVYAYDTIPTPKSSVLNTASSTQTTTAPARKLCVRHQRMADEGSSLKMQQSLDALPLKDRETVNMIWSSFSSSSHPRRDLILRGLLTMCCFSQLSLLTEQLQYLIRLDPFHVLPREVALKVLQNLDAISLGRAAQVSRHWRTLADDNILWKNICEQHIDKKCSKCGWGLPLLEKRRPRCTTSSPSPASLASLPSCKRDRDQDLLGLTPDSRPLKRQRSDYSNSSVLSDDPDGELTPRTLSPQPAVTRPWKDVYCERLTIERNWRRGRCSVRTLQGHTDGVICMQFSEALRHPSFPILITGSYDNTARIWNLETGREIRCLRGHTRGVRSLQFDEAKLITGSMDRTLRVWDWRTGRSIRTLEGHTEGIVSLNFDEDVLASGSVDTTVKIWNFRSGECFTLRGHRDWVNSVALWNCPDAGSSSPCADDATASTSSAAPAISIGKMLFSASDDNVIRLWDLALRTCVRQFSGHVAQVQCIRLVTVDPDAPENELLAPYTEAEDEKDQNVPHFSDSTLLSDSMSLGAAPTLASPLPSHPSAASIPPPEWDPNTHPNTLSSSTLIPRPSTHPHAASSKQCSRSSTPRGPTPYLVSGSLDNTIKVWDIESGKAIKTLFGHLEGVWDIACDKLRMVSGSHDRTIKVWVREEGRCMATLVGHRGPVTCIALGDDKIVSGSDDGDVKIWSFSPQ